MRVFVDIHASKTLIHIKINVLRKNWVFQSDCTASLNHSASSSQTRTEEGRKEGKRNMAGRTDRQVQRRLGSSEVKARLRAELSLPTLLTLHPNVTSFRDGAAFELL